MNTEGLIESRGSDPLCVQSDPLASKSKVEDLDGWGVSRKVCPHMYVHKCMSSKACSEMHVHKSMSRKACPERYV